MIVSVIAACVAMIAVAAALWQAREAKVANAAARQAQDEAAAARKAVEQAAASALQARNAAEDVRKAAESARQSAEVASAQASTAGAQAQQARQDADEAVFRAADAVQRVDALAEQILVERRRRGMPSFEIAPGAPDEFHLSYQGGPAVLDQVTVSVVPGSRVLGLSLGDEPPAEQVDIGPLASGVRVPFRAATGQRASAVFSVLAEPWEPVVVRAE